MLAFSKKIKKKMTCREKEHFLEQVGTCGECFLNGYRLVVLVDLNVRIGDEVREIALPGNLMFLMRMIIG